MFRKKLFFPKADDPQETRATLAAAEAVKAKRCLQALRGLWRNAKEFSHCPKVQELKDYLEASPTQERNKQAEPGSSSEGEGPQDVNIDVENDGDDAAEDSSDDVSDADGEAQPIADGRDGDPASTDDDSDSVDSLNAPTLRLGGEPSDGEALSVSSEASDLWKDSQVPGSGWLGQFYSKYGRFGKDENSDPNLPEYVSEGNKPEMLKDIHRYLQQALRDDQYPAFALSLYFLAV